MIRFITAQQTLTLRSLVLRDGLPEAECIFDHDTIPTTFHLGYFTNNNELVCILTCMKDNHGKIPKDAYRLRGMATHPDHRRKGYAAELLNAAIEHLKNQLGIEYMWFNARTIAFPFYEALGFEFISDEFDIPGIGPHREMYKLL
ncbi:GNAT family N-acetyltransferase [Sphingobacterium bovistauri]|uniref:GNAT family N-acetyltransferase n=1 Tax=Sphingobacterium bovistauri TaxID=2781959 RepID=A0ABS7Z6T4_9SPHI|nr:GNAT family N-acetyltransferase [Sphingobacterium bovistauri]MCA5005277.1 GNAT family N-acetyltransferase [Sphingobacterium bovistauri]